MKIIDLLLFESDEDELEFVDDIPDKTVEPSGNPDKKLDKQELFVEVVRLISRHKKYSEFDYREFTTYVLQLIELIKHDTDDSKILDKLERFIHYFKAKANEAERGAVITTDEPKQVLQYIQTISMTAKKLRGKPADAVVDKPVKNNSEAKERIQNIAIAIHQKTVQPEIKTMSFQIAKTATQIAA